MQVNSPENTQATAPYQTPWARIWRAFRWGASLAGAAWLAYFFYTLPQQGSGLDWASLLSRWELYLALVLMPLNYGLEAWRWKQVQDQVRPLPFSQAWRAVLVGQLLSQFIPRPIGDFGGRALYLRENNRLEGLPPWLLSNLAQFLAGIGLNTLLALLGLGLWAAALATSLSVGMMWLGLPFLLEPTLRWAEGYTRRHPWTQQWIHHIPQVNAAQFYQLLVLALARQAVVLIQVAAVMALAVGWDQPWALFGGVALVLLARTVIPSLTLLFDWALFAWMTSFGLATYFPQQAAALGALSLVVVLINRVLPSLLGWALLLDPYYKSSSKSRQA